MIPTRISSVPVDWDVEGWHATPRSGGLAPRTIGHAHPVLGKVLRDAEDDSLITKNVCKLRKPPKVAETEMVIVRDVPGLVKKLRGERLSVHAVLALFTGMRLGEILALGERRVDLDRGVIEVREALEETKAHGYGSKRLRPKQAAETLRCQTSPLREHRKRLLETRMKLGLGKLADDDLLFANLEGKPLRPSAVSSDWGELAERVGMPEVTFHALRLRHTHASQLIAQGVDIVTISKRLGHAKPSVTLAVYAHMFTSDDRKAAAAVNAALNT